MTVYRDAEAVMRLLRLLYRPQHLYVLNVDQASAALAAELRVRVLALEEEEDGESEGGGARRKKRKRNNNIFLATGTPVVYMASSASRILVQGMQWFLQHGGKFDYLISCTGSDYPLLPLAVMERVLQRRAPPFPSVMNWNHATWEDAKGLDLEGSRSGSSGADSVLARDVVLSERRPPHAPMESRGERAG